MLGIMKLHAASERGIAMRTIVSACETSAQRVSDVRAIGATKLEGRMLASGRSGTYRTGSLQVLSGLCCGLEGA